MAHDGLTRARGGARPERDALAQQAVEELDRALGALVRAIEPMLAHSVLSRSDRDQLELYAADLAARLATLQARASGGDVREVAALLEPNRRKRVRSRGRKA